MSKIGDLGRISNKAFIVTAVLILVLGATAPALTSLRPSPRQSPSGSSQQFQFASGRPTMKTSIKGKEDTSKESIRKSLMIQLQSVDVLTSIERERLVKRLGLWNSDDKDRIIIKLYKMGKLSEIECVLGLSSTPSSEIRTFMYKLESSSKDRLVKYCIRRVLHRLSK